MFFSYKDTKEKLDYLESSDKGRSLPINVNWLISTLRDLNEKCEQQKQEIKRLEKERVSAEEQSKKIDDLAQLVILSSEKLQRTDKDYVGAELLKILSRN